MRKIFNFSAGPATLPKEIVKQIKKELHNWNNTKLSILEINHRSKEFINNIAQEAERNLREILTIPKNYKILFCQGGARTQFSAIPMNLLKKSLSADYIYSGYWSLAAILEAKKYCNPKIINVLSPNKKKIIPIDTWKLSTNSSYIHYCPNETIDGISIHEPLNIKNKTIIADCSSMILSKKINITDFGVIYAGAQKNIGITGLTIIIVRDDLLSNINNKYIPSTMNYNIISDHLSMFNTPPTFSWYVSNLMFKWAKKQGGISEIEKKNIKKAKILYDAIDNDKLYENNIHPSNRSYTNITFNIKDKALEKIFLKKSTEKGLYSLKGHKAIGGIRASIYNAMPIIGVKKLIKFMKNFSKKYYNK